MAAFNKEAISFVAIDLETATSARSSICQIGITEVTKLSQVNDYSSRCV